MVVLGPNAKRRRSEDQAAAGDPPPRATEATEVGNPGPKPPAASGGSGGNVDDDVDRISGLPDDVLGEILSLLSTKEAGRTQILASRWRHVWLNSPLVLDGADLDNTLLGDSCKDFDSNDELTAAFESLAGAVAHILSAHAGPVRRFCIPSLYLHNRPATVDAWLSSPALDSLQELEFWERYERYNSKWYFRPCELAPPPASTLRFSATLQVATLGNCELPDSSVEGVNFPLLKQLGLEGVSISESSMHTVISSCPVLECLLFKGNIGVGCLQITSNSLRSIGVCASLSRFRGNSQLLQEVIIVDAPCLERFLYLDVAPPYASETIDLTIISAPKLETLGCLQEGWLGHQRLAFGTTAIQGLNGVRFTKALSTVKTLAVASKHIDLDEVIKLMKCFPCLEKLYVKSAISRKVRWSRKHRDFVKSFDIRLKTIMLKQYRGTASEVNFASFFLVNARELESMILDVGLKDYNEVNMSLIVHDSEAKALIEALHRADGCRLLLLPLGMLSPSTA